MTTEDDFQKKLDANPDDWQTRLVFADWLEEQGDPRAEGYRALGVRRLYPGASKTWSCWWGREDNDVVAAELRHGLLPLEWLQLIPGDTFWWADFYNRRKAEDAAALAFARLPPERRAELLKGVLV